MLIKFTSRISNPSLEKNSPAMLMTCKDKSAIAGLDKHARKERTIYLYTI